MGVVDLTRSLSLSFLSDALVLDIQSPCRYIGKRQTGGGETFRAILRGGGKRTAILRGGERTTKSTL